MIVVPIYDTLGDEAVEHIVEQTGIECVVVDKLEKLDRYALMKEKGHGKKLRLVIVMNDPADEPDSKRLLHVAKSAGLEVHAVSEVEQMGSSNANAPAESPPQPKDISTIYYTSGTTGVPKGVVITHGNCCDKPLRSAMRLRRNLLVVIPAGCAKLLVVRLQTTQTTCCRAYTL